MFWARLRLFWDRWWVHVIIVVGVIVSILLPIWYLQGMEKGVRDYIVGINVASLPWGILQTLVFVGFLYLLQYGGGFAQFKKARIKSEDVQVRFSDVIGLGEAKREAWEVVQLIKDRTRLKKIGGKILKGVLMVGPPGCGKTMMAKAIATEAGIPFLAVSGSEFVEIFVGVGAARVRKLFKQARQYAQAYGACIVFIDELEVVGRNRVFNAFGGSEETNSTQNQLLVEMDGLNDEPANVVVIGATNAGEGVLDAALLRPGRFDRKLHVGLPNLEERQQIFAFYARKVKVDPSVDLWRLARKAVHKTPADIENILKEAALIAMREKHEVITYKDVSASIERIELGVAHRPNITTSEREKTAYHESGHLLITYLLHPTDDVFKASIIQRKDTLGVTHLLPREERFTDSADTMRAEVMVSLAGYVAERLKYGVTHTGVSGDFESAMRVAHLMVWRFGMGGSGFVGDFTKIPAEQISENLKEKLNNETQEILRLAMKEVEKTLKAEWRILERFANELMAREELDFDEIAAIFLEYGKPPRLLPQPSTPGGLPYSEAAPPPAPAPDPGAAPLSAPMPGAMPLPAPASSPPKKD